MSVSIKKKLEKTIKELDSSLDNLSNIIADIDKRIDPDLSFPKMSKEELRRRYDRG